jgi:hypothetical protein
MGIRRLAVVGAGISIVAYVVATGAQGASTDVLKLQGGHSGPPGKSCGVAPRWTYFKIGGTVRYSGQVSGAPTGAKIRIVVERCYAPKFDVVVKQTVGAKSGGTFTGSFPVHVRSDCFAPASYGRRLTNRAYFRVR